jgi:hypothetical protein
VHPTGFANLKKFQVWELQAKKMADRTHCTAQKTADDQATAGGEKQTYSH